MSFTDADIAYVTRGYRAQITRLENQLASLSTAPPSSGTTDGMKTVANVYGQETADQLARWAIDALVEPPATISSAYTRVPTRLVNQGRAILDAAGLDWRKLKTSARSEHAERSQGRGRR